MYKLDFTKQEVDNLKSKLFLNDMEERILEYRLKEYSITKMAQLENCSESTISRRITLLMKKIEKVL